VLGTYQNNTPDLKTFDEYQEREEQEKQARILMLKGITDANNTFENLKCPKGYKDTYDTLKEMAEGTAPYFMALIYGTTGNGKTRGLEAVVLRMLERGLYVSRQRWSDVVRTMRSHFNGKSEIPYELYFDRFRCMERMIIDDIGNGTTWGDWEKGELEELIDFRYEHKLFTIITTNMELKVTASNGDVIWNMPKRIVSRFKDKSRARLVLDSAPDQRPLH
jgi:DNA replication protein DnaC